LLPTTLANQIALFIEFRQNFAPPPSSGGGGAFAQQMQFAFESIDLV